ncbi:hypothetical protein [Gorillibacterium timonense]|uniref:hypothetical protein n=1 Tax=Gorillibacterium timonense TaxID=1689269 RepID=UPI00071D4628|nr:hypothetical protein [Gorillibacterium timonense]
MISFEEKNAIAGSFAELTRKEVSMGRVNYHYEGSVQEKKIVVYHLHPNGNGFVYAELLPEYETDGKGFVNIRDFSREELHTLIRRSIRSLGPEREEKEDEAEAEAEARLVEAAVTEEQDAEGFTEKHEQWSDAEGHILELHLEPEDQMWYIFAGDQLDSAFETYEEAADYLKEEGFTR